MHNIRNFSIIAHIDHGKSTLADRLLELTGTIEKRKMQEQFLDQMELERERGITIKLQPVRMIYKIPKLEIGNWKLEISDLKYTEYILNLIDTPGHVDFTYEVSRSLAAVEGAILLVDATKGVQAQTIANLRLARDQKIVIIPVINKIDLQNARISEVEEEMVNLLGIDKKKILKISAKEGINTEEILKRIISDIPAPSENDSTSLRALIFDSEFDTYKGVIAYVRVFGGQLKSGEKIKMYATKAVGDVIEVGYFSPQLVKKENLLAGDIGYIATGFKDPKSVRVGDTVFKLKIENEKLKSEETEPLPGYKEPLPVVFASFYPEDAGQFDELKDALYKLRLTDGSLIFEPETSAALGRGFRLGFLGMLHVEIISERLKREFGLSLIISSPSVGHRVRLKNGENLMVRSASELEQNLQLDFIEEPIVRLDIITPNKYLGGIMELLGGLRSVYKKTDYLSNEVIQLVYEIPLSEIITDFYDQLKSISSGFASMSYEPTGYIKSDLIRLDIFVAGDLVEPFSRIIPREKAYIVGRAITEKLKKTIPPQLFAVSVQAAIGGKIIARETIKAMRKDVTGYLYGGDVTRKMKLLEKQKKGKKKMKEIGKVNIPQKVFLEMLKK